MVNQQEPVIWSKMNLSGLGTQRMIDTGYLTFRGTIEDGSLSLLIRMMLKGENLSSKSKKEGVFGSTLALCVDPKSGVRIGDKRVTRLLCCLLPRHLKKTGRLSTEFVFCGPDGLITNADAGIPSGATPAYSMDDVKFTGGDLRVGMVDPDQELRLNGLAIQVKDKDLKKRIENTEKKFRAEGEPPKVPMSNDEWRRLTGPDNVSKVLPEIPADLDQPTDKDQPQDLQDVLNQPDPSVFESIEKILFKGRAPTLGQLEMLTIANFPSLKSIVMEPHLVMRKIIEFPNYAKAFTELKQRCKSKELSIRFWNRVWGSKTVHIVNSAKISVPLIKYFTDVREVECADGLGYNYILSDLKHKAVQKVKLSPTPVQHVKSINIVLRKLPKLETVTFHDEGLKKWTAAKEKKDALFPKWSNLFDRVMVAGVKAPSDSVYIKIPEHVHNIVEPETVKTMKIGTENAIKWRRFSELKTLLMKFDIEETLAGINRKNLPKLKSLKLRCSSAKGGAQFERIRAMGVQVKLVTFRGKPSSNNSKKMRPKKVSFAESEGKRSRGVVERNNAQQRVA